MKSRETSQAMLHNWSTIKVCLWQKMSDLVSVSRTILLLALHDSFLFFLFFKPSLLQRCAHQGHLCVTAGVYSLKKTGPPATSCYSNSVFSLTIGNCCFFLLPWILFFLFHDIVPSKPQLLFPATCPTVIMLHFSPPSPYYLISGSAVFTDLVCSLCRPCPRHQSYWGQIWIIPCHSLSDDHSIVFRKEMTCLC